MSAKLPKKPRSRNPSGSVTPVSSENNRRARRKRAQEVKEDGEPEPGPSHSDTAGQKEAAETRASLEDVFLELTTEEQLVGSEGEAA